MRLTVWKRELLQLQLCSASLMECLRLTEQDAGVFFCNDGAGESKSGKTPLKVRFFLGVLLLGFSFS